MEEQEKKTRKSSGAKSATSKPSAAKTIQKTTKKEKVTTTEKKPKADKATTSKAPKKVVPKKEEKDIKPTDEKTINKKAEKKTRTITANRKVTENKKIVSKEPVEKANITGKKNTVTKSNAKETNERVNNRKETLKEITTIEKNKESKKSKKIVEKNETLKEPKAKKKLPKEEKSKKYIEISIGGIIAVLFIALLIVLNINLGKNAYNMTKGNNTTQNNVIDTEAEVEETIGTVLNNQNQTVNKLIEKIILPINTTASIYKVGTFDENTIPDDLKLRIGWANLKEESKFHAKQATGESIIVVEKSAMQESIKDIFGNQVKYKDVSFDNTNLKVFSTYAETQGIIDYEGESYTAIINENFEESGMSFIYQEIQKVIQYDNEIVIIMKAAFVNQEDGKCIIYQNYNDDFENKLLETTYEKLFENSVFNKKTGEGAIAISNNEELNEIRNELNTYKYIFEKDELIGEYYLKEFKKENSKA